MSKRRLQRIPFVGRRRAGFKRRRMLKARRRRTARLNIRTGGFLGREMKFLDTALTGATLSATWTGGELDPAVFLGLSCVAQGNSEIQRIGRKYTVHSIHIKGFIQVSALEAQPAPIADQITRLILVVDQQTNGAQLDAESVIVSAGAGTDVNAFRNLEFTHRFRVLKDKFIRVGVGNHGTNEGAVNSFANSQFLIPFKFNHSFKPGLQVIASDTSAIIADMVDNSIHLIGCSTAATNTITYTARCRFTG